MIRRLYIHNFRCFENFDLKFDDDAVSVIVLGKNGAGKSSIGHALRLLQTIARGDNRTRQFLKKTDFAFGQTQKPMRFELSVSLNDKQYDYGIAFEFPDKFREAKIVDEILKADGVPVYTRKEAEVTLGNADTSFMVDWHVAALPVVQVRASENPIEQFRNWIAKSVLISPVPTLITDESDFDSLEPTENVANLADWFNGVFTTYPAAYSTIDKFLKNIMPDFLEIQNKSVGESTKQIVLRFEQGDRLLDVELSRLSDGEKMFFVAAVLLAASQHLGSTLCFWDEPDNYVGLSEVGHMIVDLRKSFMKSKTGQLIITSHNPESIRKFSDESTLCLFRNSHLEPTRSKWLDETSYDGDLVNSLIRGDLPNVGE